MTVECSWVVCMKVSLTHSDPTVASSPPFPSWLSVCVSNLGQLDMTSHTAYSKEHFLHTLSIREDKQMMSKVFQKPTTRTHSNITFYASSSWLCLLSKYNHVCFPSQYRVYCVYFITLPIATEGHCFHPVWACLLVTCFTTTAHSTLESCCPSDSPLANLSLNQPR